MRAPLLALALACLTTTPALAMSPHPMPFPEVVVTSCEPVADLGPLTLWRVTGRVLPPEGDPELRATPPGGFAAGGYTSSPGWFRRVSVFVGAASAEMHPSGGFELLTTAPTGGPLPRVRAVMWDRRDFVPVVSDRTTRRGDPAGPWGQDMAAGRIP